MVVESFHAVLLDTMKQADSLGVDGRYRVLEPAVEAAFNLRLMIAVASGRYWRSAGAAERDRLTAAFRRFSVATYAARFDSFSGQSFETVAVKDGPRRTTMVDTEIRRVDEAPVALTYVLNRTDGRWRVVDVVVSGGISELAVRRSEFAATLRAGGPEALAAALDGKTDALMGR